MGTTTPNISIYIPSAGETNYDTSFAAGMVNIDQHDHSGAPNKGVPLSASGIADGSITRTKLNSNVVLAGGGLAVDGGSPNALKVDGVLLPIYQLASNGFISRTSGTTASARTMTGTANRVTITNGDGVAGNPTFTLPNQIDITGVNPAASPFSVLVNGTNVADFELAAGDTRLNLGPSTSKSRINTAEILTAVINFGTQADVYTIGNAQVWLFTAIVDPTSGGFPDSNFRAASLVFSQNNTVAEIYVTLANSNCQFAVGSANLTVALQNTSGAANRAFRVSAIRLR